MKFTQENPEGSNVFSNYGGGVLSVNETDHHSSLLIFPDLLREWPATDASALQIEDFEIFIERRPDIIILGTGAAQHFPSIDLRRELAKMRIQLDVMDTAAACRTYNLLVSEDRNVGAAVMVF